MRRKPLTEEEIAEAPDRAEGKKPEPEAKRGGRPPKYQPTFAVQAEKLCSLGATDVELADFFGVTIRTIIRWSVEHEEFCHAVKKAKGAFDDAVERRLYERAMGYTFDSEKVMAVKGEVVRVPIREHVAPDVTAQIFWLKNRQPGRWREKQQVELSGEVKTGFDPKAFEKLTEDELLRLRDLAAKMVDGE